MGWKEGESKKRREQKRDRKRDRKKERGRVTEGRERKKDR